MDTPTALTIAGSDSGGGAGIQADLKTFSALSVFGASAVTAVTAQNTRAVTLVKVLSPETVMAQIEAVRADIAVHAIKIGMLGSAANAHAIAQALKDFPGPIVLDPVMVAKSGDALVADNAVAALREALIPLARVLTPNLPEAARLLDRSVAETQEEMATQGRALRALGAEAVLMKGGHGAGPVCVDVLVTASGATAFSSARIKTRNTHGTGCSLSSAIAANLACGATLEAAVAAAHAWLQRAIARADELTIGSGHGPVHHFHAVWS
ncbi:bifunctional hydroxymethylpyrimidine kinase/phosphomethylpyrimidine kinase [Pelagibacterium luteolum]|uniref:hydroxymethylpyrimidine kinase n=1 Tax=Pelagibacterium luteolum TaxID=440168 RepID=A0A1G7ZTT0_9HYPH|nr:bifunctional hydroxymethylpyrimidine kinase/phosphomethylpyrimidine kinase [Pelagibacterium luteolum]SDH11570.1 hydroxymethylpyrimidine kinase/phosphomethylpyrimidine kinase [Pelagibacterium luteolum]